MNIEQKRFLQLIDMLKINKLISEDFLQLNKLYWTYKRNTKSHFESLGKYDTTHAKTKEKKDPYKTYANCCDIMM